MKKYTILSLLALSAFSHAKEVKPLLALEHGFSYKGEIINPQCVDLLQAWISEAHSIILRSVVIDNCQDSNIAFEGQNYEVSPDGTVYYIENPKDHHSYFGYKVLGETERGIFALLHSGSIGLYKLETKPIRFDFSKSEIQNVKVLTKLSETYTPCLISAKIKGNQLEVIKNIRNSDAPRAFQCEEDIEKITFDLSEL